MMGHQNLVALGERVVERQAVERAGLMMQHNDGMAAAGARQVKLDARRLHGGVGPIYAGHARSFPGSRMVAMGALGVKPAGVIAFRLAKMLQLPAPRRVEGRSGKHWGGPRPLSDQLTNGRALATTDLRTVRREGSATSVIAAAAVGLILTLMSVDAALQGPWLDEFWTLELSDTSRGLLPLVRERWLSDVHPPVFNLWATLLTSLGVTSIPAGRLASNLPAAGLMILAALRLPRRMPEQAGFNAALLLLVLPLGQSLEAFANYRSYFWQIAALTTLIFVARHVASTRADLDRGKDSDLAAIAVLATAGSIGLHYIGGLFGGLLAGAIGLSALARGHRRWATLMLTTAGLA